MSGPPRRLDGCPHLHQRQPRMIEKGSARVSQLDAARAADKQWYAYLIFKVSDLTAQRGLGRMQPPFCRHSEATFLSDRDEIAKVAQVQALPHASEEWRQPYKVFLRRSMSAQIPDHESDGKPSRRADRIPPGSWLLQLKTQINQGVDH